MCEEIVRPEPGWKDLAKGRFTLMKNNYGEYSLWLDINDGISRVYPIDELEMWLNLAMRKGLLNEGEIKLHRSVSVHQIFGKGDQP